MTTFSIACINGLKCEQWQTFHQPGNSQNAYCLPKSTKNYTKEEEIDKKYTNNLYESNRQKGNLITQHLFIDMESNLNLFLNKYLELSLLKNVYFNNETKWQLSSIPNNEIIVFKMKFSLRI